VLLGRGGGCSNGETAREDFELAAEAWYSGSEGVAALDMLRRCVAGAARGEVYRVLDIVERCIGAR
jgi:hypothetical protein